MLKVNRIAAAVLVGVLAASGLAQPAKPAPSSQPLPTPGPTKPPAPVRPSNPAPASPASPAQPASPGAPASPAANPGTANPPDKQGAGPLIDLRPKFKAGQTIKLKVANSSTTTTVLPEGLDVLPEEKPAGKAPPPKPEETTTQSKTTQEMVLVFKTVGVAEDGTATVDVVFESIKMKQSSDAGEEEFDSTKPPKPVKAPSGDPLQQLGQESTMEQSLRPLVGDKLTLTVDRSGNVTKVDGGEKFAALFGGLGGSAGGMPAAGGGAGGGAGGAKGLFGSIFTLDKTRPQARVGDRWTTRDVVDMAMTGALSMTTTYTLRDAKGGRATLGVNGRIESASGGEPALFKIKGGSHDGQAVWSTEDGFVQSMDTTIRMETELNLGGKAIKSTSSQQTAVTRVP